MTQMKNPYTTIRMLKILCFLSVGFDVSPKYGFAQAADLKQTREMAERGDAKAQYNLRRSYENGSGVRENLSLAINWYRKAAEKGFAPAQYSLGRIYVAGSGVPQDYASG